MPDKGLRLPDPAFHPRMRGAGARRPLPVALRFDRPMDLLHNSLPDGFHHRGRMEHL